MSTCFTIDRHGQSSSMQAAQIDSKISETLVDQSDCSAPTAASTDVKFLLADIRDREEQHFKQLLKVLTADIKDRQDNHFRLLMEHQTEIQCQVMAMESAIKANKDSQVAMQGLMAELSEDVHQGQRSNRDVRSTTKASGLSTKSRVEQVHAASKVIFAPGTLEISFDARKSEESKSSGGESRGKSFFSLSRSRTAGIAIHGLRGRASRFLKCKEFEWAIALTIAMNAFIMCWECQYTGLDVGFNLQYPGRPKPAHLVWAHADTIFQVSDWLFGTLFSVEMLLKLVCWRCKYFYDSSDVGERDDVEEHDESQNGCLLQCCQFLRGLQAWNLLDACCVIAFFFDKFSSFLRAAINPQLIRLVRLCRIFRMVRLVRYLESLDHLYIMVTALAGVKDVLVWAIVLITTILLGCDLFIVQILQATYFDKVHASDLSEPQLKRHHEMYEHFGTSTRCMLSMFEITLGNWPPIARLLSEEVSEWFTVICMIHKLTIGFAVVSVISGVILQETFKVAQTDDVIMFRQKKRAGDVLRKKFVALFHELDASGGGELGLPEVEALSDLPEIRTWLGSLGVETDDIKTLFQLLDVNGDGKITLEEMISRMPRLQGGARSIDVLALHQKLCPSRPSKLSSTAAHAGQANQTDGRIDVLALHQKSSTAAHAGQANQNYGGRPPSTDLVTGEANQNYGRRPPSLTSSQVPQKLQRKIQWDDHSHQDLEVGTVNNASLD